MVETSITTSTSTDTGPKAGPTMIPGLDFGEATHAGRVRRTNEDACASAPEIGFFVVADGVAATRGGDVAARIATASMVAFLRRQVAACSPPLPFDRGPLSDKDVELRASLLRAATANAHQMICNHAIKHQCWGAATTMAALWLAGDRVLVVHAGDSRVYRLQPKEVCLEALTRDDTALQEYADQFGAPSPKTAGELAHIVTRVLGGKDLKDPEVTLSVSPRSQSEPESYLLSTDGLHGIAAEADIAMLLACASTAQTAASALIDLANANGGGDNATATVVRIAESSGGMTHRQR